MANRKKVAITSAIGALMVATLVACGVVRVSSGKVSYTDGRHSLEISADSLHIQK